MNKTQLDKTLGTIKNYVDSTKMNYLKYGSIDVNTLKTTGIYSLSSNCTNNGTTNAGTMIVDFNVGTPFQIWLPDTTNTMYRRTWDKTNSKWSGWTNTYTGNVTGSSGSCTGNAATATKLQTARTLTIGSKGKTFNGSANVSWSLSEIGALPLSGGTLSGSIEMGANNISFTNSDTGDIVFNEGTTQVARLWQSTSGLLLAAGSNTSPTGAGVLNIPRNSNAITIGGNKIYHAGNKPTLSELGAAAANHGNHVPSQCGTVSNWNDALHNGWYMASGAANQPAGDSSTWYMGQVLCHNTNYVIQILHQFASNGGDSSKTPIFIRKKFNGSWGSWTSNFAINITGSSTGLQTSSFKPMGSGSATQPVYFSNGIPVAGKSYFAKSTVGDIGWEREDSHAPVTVSAIAFWNGAYTGSSSNLAYCNQGAFGNIVTKNQGDYAPASHNHTELTGEVKIKNSNGTFNDAWNGQECALKVGGLMAIGGTTLSSGEYRSYSANAFRAVQGDYGFFIRNDGSHTYFMLTNPGDPYGNWNNFRPITIVNSTGEALIGGTVDKWNGYRMRYGNHTGGADGYITFAW